MSRLSFILAPCVALISLASQAQTVTENPKPDFPTDEQITQILKQADRALLMNKHCLLAEESITAVDPSESVNTDNRAEAMAERTIAKIRSDTEYFHGGMGVLLLAALDDVSRNAALASAGLMNDALHIVMTQGPKNRKALEQIQNSSTCTESSAYVYTVSENLNDLEVRELKAQNLLSDEKDAQLAAVMKVLKGDQQPSK